MTQQRYNTYEMISWDELKKTCFSQGMKGMEDSLSEYPKENETTSFNPRAIFGNMIQVFLNISKT